jgi:hypothetical protein
MEKLDFWFLKILTWLGFLVLFSSEKDGENLG